MGVICGNACVMSRDCLVDGVMVHLDQDDDRRLRNDRHRKGSHVAVGAYESKVARDRAAAPLDAAVAPVVERTHHRELCIGGRLAPSLFIVGCMKCATTSLHGALVHASAGRIVTGVCPPGLQEWQCDYRTKAREPTEWSTRCRAAQDLGRSLFVVRPRPRASGPQSSRLVRSRSARPSV